MIPIFFKLLDIVGVKGRQEKRKMMDNAITILIVIQVSGDL